MTIFDMLGQSGVLTLLGMGVVIGFLFILVCAVSAAGAVIHALGLDKEPEAAPKPAAATGAGQDAGVTAAISAAVTAYRKNH